MAFLKLSHKLNTGIIYQEVGNNRYPSRGLLTLVAFLVFFLLITFSRMLKELNRSTRMHSSRMRIARSSSCPWGGSASVHPGIHHHHPLPRVWAWKPPPGVGMETPWGVGLETPPGQKPQLPLLGVGLETPPTARHTWIPPAMHVGIPTPPLQGMLGYHLQCMLGYHLPPSQWTDRYL